MTELFGIDVSVFNGTVDWKRAKSGGVQFAMVKASQGYALTSDAYLFTDGKLAANINGAAAAGIPAGVYHYLTAKTVAESECEADYFIKAINPYKSKISLWAAVDVEEGRYLPVANKPLLTSIVAAFCERVKAAGYKPMIYTNRDYMLYKLSMSGLNGIDVWQAHWSKSKPADVSDRLMIWQNEVRGSAADVSKGWATVAGSVPGVTGAVDCNIGYFELSGATSQTQTSAAKYEVGGKYTIKAGDMYSTGIAVPARLVGSTYTISQVRDDRILLAEIVSWVKI